MEGNACPVDYIVSTEQPDSKLDVVLGDDKALTTLLHGRFKRHVLVVKLKPTAEGAPRRLCFQLLSFFFPQSFHRPNR